jgi:hypothetical protein
MAQASDQDALFTLTYLFAAATVLATTLLFGVLYLCCRATAPELALLGLLLVPVYTVVTLLVYCSQLTVVPALLAFEQPAGYEAAGLLRQAVSQWSGSGVSFFSSLGYAILAVPSLFFGLILSGRQGALRWAGALLLLSGVASIVSLAGALPGGSLLGIRSLAASGFYLLALIALSVAFWPRRQHGVEWRHRASPVVTGGTQG